MTIEDILNLVDLNNWKTKREIITELQIKGKPIHERRLRILINRNNQNFYDFETNIFIAHDTEKGYKIATALSEDYEQSIIDWKKRLISIAKEVRLAERRRGEEFNLKLLLEEEGAL